MMIMGKGLIMKGIFMNLTRELRYPNMNGFETNITAFNIFGIVFNHL